MSELRFHSSDWKRLQVLRSHFLSDAKGEYWTPRDLELYDATFAQRIGWKWDAALAALGNWRPASSQLLDWGCGTGIAARAVAEWSGIRSATVHDQSRAAAAFAAESLRTRGVAARAETRLPDSVPAGTLLVISHVIGELDDSELATLAAFASTAEEVIWVEPGSREISRRASVARETLRAAGLSLLAPCTHQFACPMLDPENERHWCHFFAPPPPEVFQSAFWREFSERLQIDLRALPFSFLAASRTPASVSDGERIIGRPHERKAHVELLCCGPDGLRERTLQKRDNPELFRTLTKKAAAGARLWRTG